jgi:hypothetical protein
MALIKIELDTGKDKLDDVLAYLKDLVKGGTVAPKKVATTNETDDKPTKAEAPAPGVWTPQKEEPVSRETVQLLMSQKIIGKKAEVKALLEDCGAERLSNLDDKELPKFYKGLEAL